MFLDVEGGVWMTQKKNEQPIVKIEDLPAIKFISHNRKHSLFLDYSGCVWSRGDNKSGQLGLGDCISRTSSEKVPSSELFTAISTGDHHTLFLTEIGQVYGCGSNNVDQLGLMGGTARNCYENLTLIPGLPLISIVCAGTQHSIFVDGRRLLGMWRQL